MKILIALAAALLCCTSHASAEQGTLEDQVIEWINAASAEDLQQIKGIGKVIASRIVAKQIAEFHNYDDILAVKGIGKALLQRIIDHVEAIDPD